MKTIISLILLALCASAQTEVIPGLTPADVYLNLEAKGFTTVKKFAAEIGKEWSEFTCIKEDGTCRFTAIIYIPKGRTSEVSAVFGAVQNLQGPSAEDNALSAPFLSYLATLPYEGSLPLEAKIWVAGSMGKNIEKLFGPAKIQLDQKPAIRCLYLSNEPLKITETQSTPPAGTAPRIKTYDPATRAKSDKIPAVGTIYHEVEAEHGKPAVRDPDTGLAIWPKFKVLFKEGKAAEVTVR